MNKALLRRWLIQAFLATLLWSISKILIKLGLEVMSPMLLAGMVQFVAFLVILVFAISRRVKLVRKFSAKEIHALIWLGILGFVFAPLLAIIGLTGVTGSTAGLFAAISPIFVIIFGWLILRESLKYWQIIGVAVAFIGAYIFLSGSPFSGTTFGVMLILISELCYALNVVLTRLIMRRPGDDATIVGLAGTFIGALVLLPLGLSQSRITELANPSAWIFILAIGGIFAIAGIMWNQALNDLKAFEAGILQNTMLVQIGLLSWIFLHEQFGYLQLIGAIIVLSGAYLVNRELIKPNHARSRT